MHYHLEIIMPPTDDVHAAVELIMAPFDENANADEDGGYRGAFWDSWTIGGRFSGEKMLAQFGNERLQSFHELLNVAGVTVGSMRSGKPTLQPAGQADSVNAMWNASFPDAPMKECPLFDNYKGNAGDVMTLRDCPPITCEHVIIAAPDHAGKKLKAAYMVRDSIWNGVNRQDTTWDQTLAGAVGEWIKKLETSADTYREKCTPQPDWVVVTVDYHS